MKSQHKTKTRKLSPSLGLLGFLGFLGLIGFKTYSMNGLIFPFAFFGFFGFFGFFYEGKMSGTFMDERFLENRTKAQLKAYKIALTIIYIGLIILCQVGTLIKIDYALIAMVIIVSLSVALAVFLSECLLYHYDHDNYQADESEE